MVLDITNEQDLKIINQYKKCLGITLVNKYLPELSPINKMYVINSLEDWELVENEFPPFMMTARCDSLEGVNGKLPNGQTFNRDRVRGYIREVKNAVPEAVIILEDMKKGTNERIHTKGGINLYMKIGEYLYIDYVGPCFDARELCIGVAVHESWTIPWDEIPFMKDSAIRKYHTYRINEAEYIETAKERIAFLIKAFPDRKEEIINTMPKRYSGISSWIFRDLMNQVIFPLWVKQNQLLRDGLNLFGVEINIVEDGTLVPMEIQVPGRFKDNTRKRIK